MLRLAFTMILAVVALNCTASAAEKSFDIIGASGSSIGGAGLTSGPHGTLITISISKNGLRPGWHGIHIHQIGDCSDVGKFKNSKGHVNPGSSKHGLLNPDGPHPADLPNIYAQSDGSVHAELFAPGVFLGGSAGNLLDADGSAIVIHANPDDHMAQPIGGAGPRVACVVIK